MDFHPVRASAAQPSILTARGDGLPRFARSDSIFSCRSRSVCGGRPDSKNSQSRKRNGPDLQQLRSHGQRNDLGLFAVNARNTYRASNVREFFGAVATDFQTVPKGRPFCFAADEANER
jgi:hypothetical protein